MKHKKNLLIILIACILLTFSCKINADSGWDGDYDTSDNQSWNIPSNNKVSGTKHDRKEDENLIIPLIILGIFFGGSILIVTIILTKTKNTKKVQTDFGYDLDKIKEIIPGFNANDFKTSTFEIYKSIQTAWMNFDYETLEKYTTNELYNLYKSELTALNLKKQKNIMENFTLFDFKINDVEKGTDNVSIKVNMSILCSDYVVDKDNKVVRGDKLRMILYNYEMTFTKGLNEKDNKCPNCNAPLENNVTSTCPYCNSTVISDNHDWVLSKKRVVNQRKI